MFIVLQDGENEVKGKGVEGKEVNSFERTEQGISNLESKLNQVHTDVKVLLNNLQKFEERESFKALEIESHLVQLKKDESVDEKPTHEISSLLPETYIWKQVQNLVKYYFFIQGRFAYERVIALTNEKYLTSSSQQIKKYFATLRNEFKVKILEYSVKVELEEVLDIDVVERCEKIWKDNFGELKLLKPKENEEEIMKDIFFGSNVCLEMKWVVYILMDKVTCDSTLFSTIMKELDKITESIPNGFLIKNFFLKKK